MLSFTYDKRETGKEPVHVEFPPTEHDDIINEKAEDAVKAIDQYIAEIAPAIADGFSKVMNSCTKDFCAKFGEDFDDSDYPKFNFNVKACEKALNNYFINEYLEYVKHF